MDNPNPFAEFSTKQLANELKKRRKTEHTLECQRLTDEHALVLTHIDTLLIFTKHSRKDCVEDNPRNGSSDISTHHPSCIRCQLLRIKGEEYNPDTSVVIQLEATPIPMLNRQLDELE